MSTRSTGQPLDPTAVHTMFLPNRKGTIRRDNARRQRVHRTALQAVRGDVDTSEPQSMHFSRGVNLKKARQEEDRLDYVEKCNRKLVDKMMMIMQGLCGTIVSEQTFPDFNPGTLNYRIRKKEMLRIDRDNLALMRRIEGASSGYKRALVKPKHFQEPHMGLFPRFECSIKSVGSRSKVLRKALSERNRNRAHTTPLTVSAYSRLGSGNGVGLGGGASITSALTEPSAILRGASAGTAGTDGTWSGAEPAAQNARSASPELADEELACGIRGVLRSPQPPPISSRATYGSTSQRTTLSGRNYKRRGRHSEVKPGGIVFRAGAKIGDEYTVVTITRATRDVAPHGANGFRVETYFPTVLSVYFLNISATVLPAFTTGSRTAVRHMFHAGEVSRTRWDVVVSCLELRILTPSTEVEADTDIHQFMEPAEGRKERQRTASDSPGEMASSMMIIMAVDGEPRAVPSDSLELVLVPPADAPIVSIQRVVRGGLTRNKYRTVKASTLTIQSAMRGWRDRVGRVRHNAATKIAAAARGIEARSRVKRELAARGIQRKSRAWLKRRDLERAKAARQIQTAIRNRNLHRDRDAQELSLQSVSSVRDTLGSARSSNRRARRTLKRPPPALSARNVISTNSGGGSSRGTKHATSEQGSSGGGSRNRSWENSENTHRASGDRTKEADHGANGQGSGSIDTVAVLGETEATTGLGLASTPPRERKPKPPETKGLIRSPYSRPRRGWSTETVKQPAAVRSPDRCRPARSTLPRDTGNNAKRNAGTALKHRAGSPPAFPGLVSVALPPSTVARGPDGAKSPRGAKDEAAVTASRASTCATVTSSVAAQEDQAYSPESKLTLPFQETATPEPFSGKIGSSGHLRDRVSLSEAEETQQRMSGQDPERHQTSAPQPEDIATEPRAPLAEPGALGLSEQANSELCNAESTVGEARLSQAQGGEGGKYHHHHRLSDLCVEDSATGGKVPLVETGTAGKSLEQRESGSPKEEHAGYTATKFQGEGHGGAKSDYNRRSSVPWAESIAAEKEASLEMAGTAETSSGCLSFDSPNAAAERTRVEASLSKAERDQRVAFASVPGPLSENSVAGEAPPLDTEAVAMSADQSMPGRLQGGEEPVNYDRKVDNTTGFSRDKRRPSVSWAEELEIGISTSADILVGVLEPTPSQRNSLEPSRSGDHGGVMILSGDEESHRVSSEDNRRSSIPWVEDVAGLSSTSQEAHTLTTMLGESKSRRPSIEQPHGSAAFSTATEDLGRTSGPHRTSVSWAETIATDKKVSISEVKTASPSEQLGSRAPNGVSATDSAFSTATEDLGRTSGPHRTSVSWAETIATDKKVSISEVKTANSSEQLGSRAPNGVSATDSAFSTATEDLGRTSDPHRTSVSWAETIAIDKKVSILEVKTASSSEQLGSRAPNSVSATDSGTSSKEREGEDTDAQSRQRTSVAWVEEVATPSLSESRATESP